LRTGADDETIGVEGSGMTSARGLGNQQTLITGDELARMPDHDLCELIDGRIVPMSPTNPEHGRIELNIAMTLRDFARTQNLGIVMTGEVGIFTKRNPDRVRGADVVFISHSQYERRTKTRGFLDVAPELVVEILSPEHRHIDMGQKVLEYLAIGVLLVLVVDPDDRTIAVYRSDGTMRRCGEGDAVPCDEVLPGFTLIAAEVFEI
jgi:Uma2 family endonuclease